MRTLAIFARCAWLARGRRGCSVEHAVSFDPQEFVRLQVCCCQQKGGTTVPAIRGNDRTDPLLVELSNDVAQLLSRHLGTLLPLANALLIEHIGPGTGLLRQGRHRRGLLAVTDRARTSRLVGHIDHAAIRRGVSLGPGDTARINPQPHTLSVDRQRHMPDKDPLQGLMINAPIFKGFIQAGALPLEAGRERQLQKAASPRLRQEGIRRVEQRIGRSLKTAIDRRSESGVMC